MTSSPSPATVRVVVVTYSPGAHLAQVLDSLSDTCSRPYEVVLADNGSTDGAPEDAAARYAGVSLRPTGGNLGYGRAVNVGADGFEGDWLLVCNPDLQFATGAIDALLAAAARWPRGGAFGPQIREPDGSVYPSARELPSLGRGIGHALAGRVWPGNPWTRAYRREGQVEERESGWLSGACQLMRRSAFDSVGGFDPQYFMYFEDVDLGDRLQRAGWQNVYVPGAVVVHEGGTTTRRLAGPMLRAHHDSAARYLSGRHSPAVAAMLRLGLGLRYRLLRGTA